MRVNIKKFLIILLILLYLTTPVCANVKLISSLTHKYKVTKGCCYKGKIVVVNKASNIAAVKLYKRDYKFNAEGQSYYLQPGSIKRTNSNWIKIAKNRVDIPGKATREIPYIINVPFDNELVGTYWSMLMVEQLNNCVNELSINKEENKIMFKQNLRYGVQIITSFQDDGYYDILFKNPGLIKQNKNNIFMVDIINQGQCLFTPVVWMDIYKNSGVKVDRYYGKKIKIYPGTSVRQQINLNSIKPGHYKSVLIADGGNTAVFGNRYNLEIVNK